MDNMETVISVNGLTKQFGSFKRIKSASLAELQAIVGPARGEKLYENLHAAGNE